MLKQITKNENIVNIATKDNLNKTFLKQQNKKEFDIELEQIEKAKNMKQYFTSEELNDLLFVSHLLDLTTRISNEWLKRGNLLISEANLANMGASYTKRFLDKILLRMPKKEIEKFVRRTVRAKEDPIRIVDKWLQDRVFGTYETEHEIVKIERPQLETLAMKAIRGNCSDCNDSYRECDLYDILEDNLVPRCEIRRNCAYSFASKKNKPKEESKANKSKRAINKKANRFDEDEEILEYNFIKNNKK
ncbi:MAG: DUF5651 domain-containing protein [Clostridia bacterium]